MKISPTKFNRLLLLSFPRSGSVFLLYCLQYCFRTYRVNQSPQLKNIIGSFADFVPENKVQILKNHHFSAVKEHDISNNAVIFMLRDFKECIPSHCLQVNSNDYLTYLDIYCNELLAFGQWQHEKIFLYYEDFIDDTVNQVREIIEQLNPDYKMMLEKFEKDIQTLSSESLLLKKKLGSPSLSGGANKVFHRNALNKDVLQQMVSLVETRLKDSEVFDLVKPYMNV